MWHMDGDWGWWVAFGWLWMVIFWGLVIGGIVLVVRRIGGEGRAPSGRQTPLEILEERYARGELDDEEFERRRARLLGREDRRTGSGGGT